MIQQMITSILIMKKTSILVFLHESGLSNAYNFLCTYYLLCMPPALFFLLHVSFALQIPILHRRLDAYNLDRRLPSVLTSLNAVSLKTPFLSFYRINIYVDMILTLSFYLLMQIFETWCKRQR